MRTASPPRQDDAVAVALANGAGQIAIAGVDANAFAQNSASGTIDANAVATAQSGGTNDTAVAIAAALGMDQVAVGSVFASATVRNFGVIDANATAKAYGTRPLQLVLRTASDRSRWVVFTGPHFWKNATIRARSMPAVNATASGRTAVAVGLANGAGQLAVGSGSPTLPLRIPAGTSAPA